MVISTCIFFKSKKIFVHEFNTVTFPWEEVCGLFKKEGDNKKDP